MSKKAQRAIIPVNGETVRPLAIVSSGDFGCGYARIDLRFDGEGDVALLRKAFRNICSAGLPPSWRVLAGGSRIWLLVQRCDEAQARAFLERMGREVLS